MSGMLSQIGFAPEVTYGTRVAPTRFFDFVSEAVKLDMQRIDSKAVRAGSGFQRVDRRVNNAKGATGEVELEVSSAGFGILLKHIFGAVDAGATPEDGTTSKVWTFTMADAPGSLTCQIGRPDVTDVVRPFDYLGCTIPSAEFSCDVDGLLMLKATLDARQEVTGQSLATQSIPAGTLFSYVSGTITLGGTPIDVTTWSTKIDRTTKVDRYYVGTPLKKVPLRNGMFSATGNIECDFDGMTHYNAFVAGDVAELVVRFETLEDIETGVKGALEFTCSAIQFDGETPTVGGPELLTQPLPFTVLDNGTDEPISVAYTTLDTTP